MASTVVVVDQSKKRKFGECSNSGSATKTQEKYAEQKFLEEYVQTSGPLLKGAFVV